MGLKMHTWGAGDRTALLVHGMTTAAGSFWRLGPELAGRGYRVLAPDLPGHGESGHRDTYTREALRDALAATAPPSVDLALGHSLGGLLLLLARERIRAGRYVYVDPAWGPGPDASVERFLHDQVTWSLDRLAAAHPRWERAGVEAKHRALARWDTRTTAVMRDVPGIRPGPATAPSLVLLADPSDWVTPAEAARLAATGYTVRTVPGTGHTVHNDDFGATMAALDGWL